MPAASLGIELRRLLALAVETALTRMDLARLEFAQWRGGLKWMLLFAVGGAISAWFALQTLVVAILVQCWDTCRETAAWSLAGFFGAALALCLVGLAVSVKHSRRFLPATREVLLDDLESLKDEYTTRSPTPDA